MTTPKEARLWRREIKHGPEGEANYAWVYDGDGEMVCTAKTHHAEAIVTRMNATASLQGEDAVERVAQLIEEHVTAHCDDERCQTWLDSTRDAAETVLATGLALDEAAVRADEREKCAVQDQIIGQIEERFPNWRSFRNLIDCIDVTLHNLRAGYPS